MYGTLIRAEFSDSTGIAFHYYSDGRVIGFQNDAQTRDEAVERVDRHLSQDPTGEDFIPSTQAEVAEHKDGVLDFETIYEA